MPREGLHYPGSYAAVLSWFPDDDACLDYLDWLRWPDGFACPHCGCVVSWEMKGRIRRCADCRRRVSRTAGTIFQDTRTPLTVWFAAAWYMTSAKNGVSALQMQRLLGLGSYQTAWTMLHRFRTAMGLAGQDKLSGTVEVDETFVGGEHAGLGGRGAFGKEIVIVAVELLEPKGFGRVRLAVIPNASTKVLREFLLANIERGSTVVTDGWQPYRKAVGNDFDHIRHPISSSGFQAHELLPAVHRVAALLKRWLLGTHQGSMIGGHLPAYLDEFTFRFNRRRASHRGLVFYRLLQLAVGAPPVTYRELVVNSKPKGVRPAGVLGPRGRPGTLALPPADKPWRQTQSLD
jgi:transposase-like protein